MMTNQQQEGDFLAMSAQEAAQGPHLVEASLRRCSSQIHEPSALIATVPCRKEPCNMPSMKRHNVHLPSKCSATKPSALISAAHP